MKRAQQGTASGFATSRNEAAHGSKKKPTTAAERRLDKVDQAKRELSTILEEAGEHPAPPPGSGLKKSATRFADEVNKVRRSVSNSREDFNAEAANRALLRAILATTLDLIPRAEKNYRREGKEQQGYVYVALCKQAQELAIDLRQMSDVENQSKFISESILHPFFIAITQNMLQELMTVKNMVDTECTSRKEGHRIKTRIDNTMRTMGQFFTEAHSTMSLNVSKYLSGDLSFTESAEPAPKKRKRARR